MQRDSKVGQAPPGRIGKMAGRIPLDERTIRKADKTSSNAIEPPKNRKRKTIAPKRKKEIEIVTIPADEPGEPFETDPIQPDSQPRRAVHATSAYRPRRRNMTVSETFFSGDPLYYSRFLLPSNDMIETRHNGDLFCNLWHQTTTVLLSEDPMIYVADWMATVRATVMASRFHSHPDEWKTKYELLQQLVSHGSGHADASLSSLAPLSSDPLALWMVLELQWSERLISWPSLLWLSSWIQVLLTLGIVPKSPSKVLSMESILQRYWNEFVRFMASVQEPIQIHWSAAIDSFLASAVNKVAALERIGSALSCLCRLQSSCIEVSMILQWLRCVANLNTMEPTTANTIYERCLHVLQTHAPFQETGLLQILQELYRIHRRITFGHPSLQSLLVPIAPSSTIGLLVQLQQHIATHLTNDRSKSLMIKKMTSRLMMVLKPTDLTDSPTLLRDVISILVHLSSQSPVDQRPMFVKYISFIADRSEEMGMLALFISGTLRLIQTFVPCTRVPGSMASTLVHAMRRFVLM
jgi:hypothetical protein